ncbi:MAG: MlaD family protein [Solirubrobacterales bacterium]|nr:MlaD family protein [Solirubrobacterales bacterium]
MKPARIVTLLVAAVAVVLVGIVLFGGSSNPTYVMTFETAGQLVKDNDVQVGGRRVGKVSEIQLTANNQANITIEVQEPYAPLHEGTTAIMRATSLSGVANRYIALTPGPQNAPLIAEGETIPVDQTTTIVDIDQLFNTLDPDTTKGLAEVIQGFGTWYRGRGVDARKGLPYLSPALNATIGLLEKLNSDQPALEQMVQSTSSVVGTLAAKGPTLTNLVTNANISLGAIGDENQSLAEALQYLPQTLRRGSTTFVNLRTTLGAVDQLVAASLPATKNLAPFLTDLDPLFVQAKPTITDLALTVSKPGANNDFTSLMQDAPALNSGAQKAFPASITAINDSLPTLSYARPYAPDLVGFLREFGQSTANYDANGHYARASPAFGAFNFNGASLDYLGTNRDAWEQNGPTIVPRCPGAATQAPPDGSAPWQAPLYPSTTTRIGCNPAIVPPGSW